MPKGEKMPQILTKAPEDEGDDQEAKEGTDLVPTKVTEAEIEDAPDQDEDEDDAEPN